MTTTGPNHPATRTDRNRTVQTETPIYDQLARERDAMQDPEGLALVAAIHDRHTDQCATHDHHRRTLAGWFGWVK